MLDVIVARSYLQYLIIDSQQYFLILWPLIKQTVTMNLHNFVVRSNPFVLNHASYCMSFLTWPERVARQIFLNPERNQ